MRRKRFVLLHLYGAACVCCYFRELLRGSTSRHCWKKNVPLEWMELSQLSLYMALVRTRANIVVWKGTKTAKNSYNVSCFAFGPDQSKWTIGLSWCEYTLRCLQLLEETLQHTPMMHEHAASVGIAQKVLKHSICVFICDSSVVPIKTCWEGMSAIQQR